MTQTPLPSKDSGPGQSYYSSWKFLVIGSIIIFAIIGAVYFVLYASNLAAYQTVLVITLTSYFPLSYLSYLQTRAETHKKRVIEDSELLGLTSETDVEDLENAYSQIYAPRQFLIPVTLAVIATLLGIGLFYAQSIIGFKVISPEEARIVFYSFLGAYIFSVYYVYRRYVTFDLQPNIYIYVTARIITVQAVALVGAQLLQSDNTLATAMVPIVAFIIGYFPDTGIRWLTSVASRYLGKFSNRTEQSLSKIDGISLWHETRLRESGIDNVQNLAAADVRELILNSRFTTQQLMNWIDQAILMTILPEKYAQLNEHGIGSISALRRTLENIKPDMFPFERMADPNGAGSKTNDDTAAPVTISDLWIAYHAADTGPNLHYVVPYWNSVKQLKQAEFQQKLEKLLEEQQAQTTTGQLLDDVLSEQLQQMMDNFKLSPEKLEQMYQNSPERLSNLGLVYINRQQYAAAIRVLDRAITLDSKNVAAYRARGSAWSLLGDYTRAFEDFRQAQSLNPQDAVTHNSEGSAYLRQGLFEQAISAYEQAISLNPEYASAYFNLGSVYERRGEHDAAIGKFNQAIRYAPELYQAYIERGAIYLLLKDHQQAIADFRQAIHYDRNNPLGYHNRGVAYMMAGKFKRATYDFDAAIDIDPYRAESYLELGKAYLKLHELDEPDSLSEAITNFTEAIRLDNTLAQAYRQRSKAYEAQGKLLEAIADVDRFIQCNPLAADKAEAQKQKLLEQYAQSKT